MKEYGVKVEEYCPECGGVFGVLVDRETGESVGPYVSCICGAEKAAEKEEQAPNTAFLKREAVAS